MIGVKAQREILRGLADYLFECALEGRRHLAYKELTEAFGSLSNATGAVMFVREILPGCDMHEVSMQLHRCVREILGIELSKLDLHYPQGHPKRLILDRTIHTFLSCKRGESDDRSS